MQFRLTRPLTGMVAMPAKTKEWSLAHFLLSLTKAIAEELQLDITFQDAPCDDGFTVLTVVTVGGVLLIFYFHDV